MPSKKAKRTAGMIALAKVGRTPDQIANETGMPPVLVRQLLTGHKTPSADWRKKIQKVYANVSPKLWDEAAPVFTPKAEGGATSVTSLTNEYIEMVRAMMTQIKADPTASPEYKTKLLRGCLTALNGAAKLSGESGEISEAKILKSPAWARIRVAMFDALIQWPDATEAVSNALVELHGT